MRLLILVPLSEQVRDRRDGRRLRTYRILRLPTSRPKPKDGIRKCNQQPHQNQKGMQHLLQSHYLLLCLPPKFSASQTTWNTIKKPHSGKWHSFATTIIMVTPS